MKKSAVAVAVIVVLGAAWSGASWYTGKLIEQRMDGEVARLNESLTQRLPQAGLKISYQDYQRGVFSSRVRYIIQADPAAKQDALLKPGQQLALNETISHGPFPLTHFSLEPSMAVVHSELANTPLVAPLFTVNKGQSPLDAYTRIAYSGDNRSEITLLPLSLQAGENKIDFGGAQIKADVARDLSRMDLAAEAKSLSIDAPNGGQRETLSLTGATFTTHSKMGKFGLNIGEQQIAAKRLSLSVDGKESAALDDLAMNASLKEGERTLDARVDYRLGALQIDGKAFGGGAMTLDLNGFDGHGVKTFADEYNAFISRQLSSGHSSDSAAYQQQLTSMLDAALPTLLSGNPRIDLKPVTWKNSAGSSQFDLSLSLGAPAKTEAAAALPPLLQAVRTLDVSLNLSMPMATQIAANAAELEGYQADEAQKLAAQQVQGVSAMGQMFKLTTQQDNAIVSQLRYADGQVTLNGKQMTLAQFAGLFGVLGGMDSAPTGAQ
ncbi:DUF945 domain-containing protein [Edwardsiella anguillarum]|uniref:YdgA family protein n=1 Tax=Edwardsiella TaxID=635 RepID=UPI00045CC58B|nr:YdgA family protein [Edwardsiella anguillarum]AKM47893.1 GTP-binding protein YdgA [Edwardsiella sp. EA181011]GAJ68850.1 putative GTP-binding protein YdgA [Edwardsiella piscicida]RFT05455.1 DUF945 domain-containing protein [Edwardsiella anguillarum]BET80901.1 DUF945 domain-containing protein [Edwardsiella anguillarum]BET84190.1 DUF945 domain-containing protein [Edwardsiella anguillarum]